MEHGTPQSVGQPPTTNSSEMLAKSKASRWGFLGVANAFHWYANSWKN